MRTRLLTTVMSFAVLPLAAQSQPPGTTTTAGPTTRVLAIGHLNQPPFPELRATMPGEVSATVQLYLNGKIDQWYARKDQNGVVFVMNVTSVDEARTLLEALPLGQKKLMSFDLIPLGPLSPLRFLLGTPADVPKPATAP